MRLHNPRLVGPRRLNHVLRPRSASVHESEPATSQASAQSPSAFGLVQVQRMVCLVQVHRVVGLAQAMGGAGGKLEACHAGGARGMRGCVTCKRASLSGTPISFTQQGRRRMLALDRPQLEAHAAPAHLRSDCVSQFPVISANGWLDILWILPTTQALQSLCYTQGLGAQGQGLTKG